MGEVLQIVHRLRKAEEHRARADLAQAQSVYEDNQDRLRQTEAALERSATVAVSHVMQMQAMHQGALRLELQRRAQERDLMAAQERAGDAQTSFSTKARDAKVVELVATALDSAQLVADRRRTRATFDEQGLQSWWRRSA